MRLIIAGLLKIKESTSLIKVMLGQGLKLQGAFRLYFYLGLIFMLPSFTLSIQASSINGAIGVLKVRQLFSKEDI